MTHRLVLFALLLGAILAASGCNSRPDAAGQKPPPTGGTPNATPVSAPRRLRDTVQLLLHQLDTLHRTGDWDADFARLMQVHHTGAQRLAAIEISQGQDSTLRGLAQHVLKEHERDTHVLMLATTRERPTGRDYRPGNSQDAFVRRIAAALAPLRQLPPLPGTPDAAFATVMQRHHQSGVALAQAELAMGQNAQLKQAAREIVRDEQQEIKQYQRWLEAHPVDRVNQF